MMASLGPSPLRKVLVLGGGDGGVATVALKYPMVELLQACREGLGAFWNQRDLYIIYKVDCMQWFWLIIV